MEFWRSRNFRQLAKTWNQKLEEVGFIDSEIDLKGDRSLRQRATNAYRQASELERESRLGYYRLLGYLANNEQFQNALEELVMQRHADGASIKEIVNEVKQSGLSRDRKTIRHIIRRWQMKWGVKTWSLRQMNLKKTIG